MTNVLAFDLSTTQTGVAIAALNDNTLVELITVAITPRNPSPTDLGFLKNKQKTTTKTGIPLQTYVKYKGEKLSKAEGSRRNVLVKRSAEEARLNTTTREINKLVEIYKPTLVLMEANMAFRNMNTTRQLAEVAGCLQAIATTQNIPLEKINVATARSHWNLSKECIAFSRRLETSELAAIKDLTKETLKYLMIQVFDGYKLNKDMSTDESDALVLLHHWLVQQRSVIRNK